MIPGGIAGLGGGADWLGVVHVHEALALRKAGIAGRMLSLLGVPGAAHEIAIRQDVDLSAAGTAMADEGARPAARADRPARLHLKVDTGRSRAGAPLADWPAGMDAALSAEDADACRTVDRL